MDALDKLPMFQDLTPTQRDLLRRIFIPCDCYGDACLFNQGDIAEHMYLVISGEVAINYKPEDGSIITMARVGPGGVVGWSAALGNPYYTSSAICTIYTQMLRVRSADLRNLCQECPETGILILDRLAAVIAERLRNTHEQVIALLKQGLLSSYG
jgi:CRP-like cAMP-binding protein